MTDRLADAVRNNAKWCDTVCRAHGVPTSWRSDWWCAGRRSPRFYPDAITLRPTAEYPSITMSIEAGGGSSVKDSWANLDLAPYGFTSLFDACWITLDAPAADAPAETRWTVVASAGDLEDWTVGHGSVGTFPPSLLDDPAIRFLAVRAGGRTVAGAIANLSGAVVGVSNLFGENPWRGLPTAVAASFPGRPLVGYERSADLEQALGLGFRTVGRLRIWRRPDERGAGIE